MDRYIVREPRIGAEYPQGNQTIPFPPNAAAAGNSMIPQDNTYYGLQYATEYQNIQLGHTGFMGVPQFNTRNVVQVPGQGQVVSGIDPRYLVNFSDNSAQYIVSGQRNTPHINSVLGNDYENRSVLGPDRNNTKIFKPLNIIESQIKEQDKHLRSYEGAIVKCYPQNQQTCQTDTPKHGSYKADVKSVDLNQQRFQFQRNSNVIPQTKNTMATDTVTNEIHDQIVTRSDKLKALHKSGPRVFSGPVEKILKWHKSLQDIGVLVLYEIVAKCVSVRRGETCAKNLVVRDENGPAIQVVYYEIDFLLPELKPPCTVRVIGRMMVGTSRLQAFNVRPATGDDVATLPRRAAVAAHHVSKLCKEYGAHV